MGLARYKGEANKNVGGSPDDLRTLTELGLIEMHDEVPALTNEGERALDWS